MNILWIARLRSLAALALVPLAWSTFASACDMNDAAMKGGLDKIKMLLKDNPEFIFSKDKDGCTPLLRAVWFDRKDMVELLLASKANVDAKDVNGWTALHYAADDGKRDVAELLLAYKADVNATTVNGPKTEYVADAGTDDSGHLVMKTRAVNKADRDTEATGGWTPLSLAALEDRKEMINLLLSHKAAVNAKTSNGWTPLHWAVSKGNKGVADLLRQHGGHE